MQNSDCHCSKIIIDWKFWLVLGFLGVWGLLGWVGLFSIIGGFYAK